MNERGNSSSSQSSQFHEGPIKAIKAVKFRYTPTALTQELLLTFRDMVNQAIGISLEEGVKGRLKLRDRIYKDFQLKFGITSCLPYSVAEVAWSIVKKHKRWNRKPFAKRLMMKIDSQNFTLFHSLVSIPFKKGMRVLVPLQFGDYQRSFLSNDTLKMGSLTLTDSYVIIAFTKFVILDSPTSKLGIDLNEKSAVCSDGTKYDLSEVARLKTEYGIRRSKFWRKHQSDRRLKRKYGHATRETERVTQFLHRTTKVIVETAKSKGQSIVLERLEGIRFAHQKGNGEGSSKRRRFSRWPYHRFQTYILYKANWEGVRVEFVGAALTSKTCHICQYVNRGLTLDQREWRCPKCGATLDRDLNAAINILRRGEEGCLGEVRPGAKGKDEADEGESDDSGNPPSRSPEVGKAGMDPPSRQNPYSKYGD
jgi:putative transposase